MHKGGERCDNTTAIALEWESPDRSNSSRNISTETIDEGVFATTIQGGTTDADLSHLEDLDDDAIERSIAEINEAIRRSAERKNKN